MRAFKFLDAHGRSPFAGMAWTPDQWVEADTVVPCHAGIHACRPEHLAYWLNESLWEIDLDGSVVDSRHKIAAPRARLVRSVVGYRDAVRDLAEVGAWRSRDRAVVVLREAGHDDLAARYASCEELAALAALGEDALATAPESTFEGRAAGWAADAAHFALHGDASQSPFVACCSAGHVAAGPSGDQRAYDEGYAAERTFQSRWLTDRLALDR
jgi:hypothetical protein